MLQTFVLILSAGTPVPPADFTYLTTESGVSLTTESGFLVVTT